MVFTPALAKLTLLLPPGMLFLAPPRTALRPAPPGVSVDRFLRSGRPGVEDAAEGLCEERRWPGSFLATRCLNCGRYGWAAGAAGAVAGLKAEVGGGTAKDVRFFVVVLGALSVIEALGLRGGREEEAEEEVKMGRGG